MKKILIILVFLFGGIILGYLSRGCCRQAPPLPEVEIRIDTIIRVRVDTIVQWLPEPGDIEIVDTIIVTDIVRDTVYLPIERKTYRGSLYTVIISGYRPNLDYIEVYPRTITQTIREREKVYERPKKWGIGIQAGVGFTKDLNPTPYIGIGLQRSLIRF